MKTFNITIKLQVETDETEQEVSRQLSESVVEVVEDEYSDLLDEVILVDLEIKE